MTELTNKTIRTGHAETVKNSVEVFSCLLILPGFNTKAKKINLILTKLLHLKLLI